MAKQKVLKILMSEAVRGADQEGSIHSGLWKLVIFLQVRDLEAIPNTWNVTKITCGGGVICYLVFAFVAVGGSSARV